MAELVQAQQADDGEAGLAHVLSQLDHRILQSEGGQVRKHTPNTQLITRTPCMLRNLHHAQAC